MQGDITIVKLNHSQELQIPESDALEVSLIITWSRGIWQLPPSYVMSLEYY